VRPRSFSWDSHVGSSYSCGPRTALLLKGEIQYLTACSISRYYNVTRRGATRRLVRPLKDARTSFTPPMFTLRNKIFSAHIMHPWKIIMGKFKIASFSHALLYCAINTSELTYYSGLLSAAYFITFSNIFPWSILIFLNACLAFSYKVLYHS
jgi:hypothetical protein